MATGLIDFDHSPNPSLSGFVRDTNLSNPHNRLQTGYDPADYVVSPLAKAATTTCTPQQAIWLEIGDCSLLLEPHANRCWSPQTDDELRALCLMPLGTEARQHLLPLPAARTQFATRHGRLIEYRLDHLLAETALRSARGRLPYDFNPQTPLHLKTWPNLTRLPLTTGALRIAMLWRRRSVSFTDTCTVLGLAQRHVAAFYSMCAALDLLSTDTTQAPGTSQGIEPRPAVARKQVKASLLRRLLGTLDAILHR